jgi:hypothetical protein
VKRLLVVLVTLLLAVGVAASPSDAAEARGCAVTWGSAAKSAGPSTSPSSPVRNVRTGRHACYDRLVVDLGGPASGYAVRYVRRFRAEGSNDVIPLPGGARLEIVVRAPAVNAQGQPTYPAVVGQPLPGVDVGGCQTFRSTRYGGSFEGLTKLGLGVRARLPFRVQKLGNRVVIDVAHHW